MFRCTSMLKTQGTYFNSGGGGAVVMFECGPSVPTAGVERERPQVPTVFSYDASYFPFFFIIFFPSLKQSAPPCSAVCELFGSPANRSAPRVHQILTNISKNSSPLTSLSQTCISRLAAGRGGDRWVGGWEKGRGDGGGEEVLFLEGGRGGHSCQPSRAANRHSGLHRVSHGSAAPSQWRAGTGESGRVCRREENNQ